MTRYYVTIRDEAVRVDALLTQGQSPRLIGSAGGTNAFAMLADINLDGDIETQIRSAWEDGYEGDTEQISVEVTQLNDTQCGILDRFEAGETEIRYMPQSVIGGEVVSMQERGLAELVQDGQGYLYLTPAE